MLSGQVWFLFLYLNIYYKRHFICKHDGIMENGTYKWTDGYPKEAIQVNDYRNHPFHRVKFSKFDSSNI